MLEQLNSNSLKRSIKEKVCVRSPSQAVTNRNSYFEEHFGKSFHTISFLNVIENRYPLKHLKPVTSSVPLHQSICIQELKTFPITSQIKSQRYVLHWFTHSEVQKNLTVSRDKWLTGIEFIWPAHKCVCSMRHVPICFLIISICSGILFYNEIVKQLFVISSHAKHPLRWSPLACLGNEQFISRDSYFRDWYMGASDSHPCV